MVTEFIDIVDERAPAPLSIEYRWLNRRRDAPILVFLHEGLGSVAMWRDWPQALCDASGMAGLVYSRPGYGHSTPRPPGVKWPVDFMEHQAGVVLPALLDALALDPAQRRRMWLVGHSDGATIALLYASRFPSELAGAVVIAPHVFVEALSLQGIAQAKLAYEKGTLRGSPGEPLREKLERYHADVDSAFYGWHDIWLDPAFKNWSMVDALDAISVPVLAIQAHDDQYGSMAQIDAIAQHVPSARLAKLPVGGHSPQRNVPAQVESLIMEFFVDLEVVPAGHRTGSAALFKPPSTGKRSR